MTGLDVTGLSALEILDSRERPTSAKTAQLADRTLARESAATTGRPLQPCPRRTRRHVGPASGNRGQHTRSRVTA